MKFSFAQNLQIVIKEMISGSFNILSAPNMIPRRIHQLWIPPAHLEHLPEDVLPQIHAWRDLHPDFEHRLWTVDEVANNLPASRAARMMDAVQISRFEAMKADIVRLYLLSEFGGFWSDLKVRPKRRWLNGYLNKELFLVEHFRFEQLLNPAGVLTNNLIGSTPKNPFIEACIERAHMNIDERLSTSVWHIAGIKIYMDICAEMKRQGKWPAQNVILSSDDVWNELVELGGGSYSANQQHWSVREKNETIYLDYSPSDQGPGLR